MPLKHIAIGLLVMLCASCHLLQHAHQAHEQRVFVRVMQHDTTVVHTDSVHRDTMYTLGAPVYIDCDKVQRNADGRRIAEIAGSPMVEFVFDTVFQTKEKWIENTARLAMTRDSLKKDEAALVKAKGKVNGGWRLAACLLGALLIIFFWTKKL